MELPIYELMISEDLSDNSEVNFVSLVERPAIQKNWQAFNDKVKFSIANEEKRIISGAIMLADTPIYRRDDSHGEYYVIFSKDTIFQIVQRYFKKKYQFNVNINHRQDMVLEDVYMFESFISDKSRGILPMKGFEDAPDGSWFGSMKVDNDYAWSEAKAGNLNGFSVEGIFEYSKKPRREESIMQEIYNILMQVELGGEGSGCQGPNCGRPSGSGSDNIVSSQAQNMISNIEDGNLPSLSEIIKLDKESPKTASIVEDLLYNNTGSYKALDNDGKKIFDNLTTTKNYELYRVDNRYTVDNVKIGDNLDFEKSPTFVASDINYVNNLSKSRGINNPSVIVFENGTKSIRHRKNFENGSHEVIRGKYKVSKIQDNKIFVKSN